MYEWVVFLHVASVLALMLAHGVHVSAMWAMRAEPNPDRMLTFFNIVPPTTILRILLAIVVLSGVSLGWLGSWWGAGWIWTSLALLAFISVAMWRFGWGFFGLLQAAAEAAIEARSQDPSNLGPQAAYDTARRSWHTPAVSVVGLAGLAIILWLMMFKPF